MEDLRMKVEEIVQDLKQQRDELHVKVRLAKMEADEEWTEIEEKFAKLDSKARKLGKATAQASKDIGAAAKLLGEEVREGLRKFAKNL